LKGEHHSELISTQITLRERLESDSSLPNLYYVVSDVQTSGRGRGDHAWVSAQGNLHVSILIRDVPLELTTWVPLWVSIGVHRVLNQLTAPWQSIQLKWPNDLLLTNGSKVGGILCEKKGNEIIAGIGLNLVHAPIDRASVVPFREEGEDWSALKVLESVLKEYQSLPTIDQLKDYYDLHSFFRTGDLIQWNSKDRMISGTVLGLGRFGELRVDVDGQQTSLYSEDVTRVSRPTGTSRSI